MHGSHMVTLCELLTLIITNPGYVQNVALSIGITEKTIYNGNRDLACVVKTFPDAKIAKDPTLECTMPNKQNRTD